ncbi:response regulator [Hydrogenophaga sp. D2P1]|uniref:Sensory/regulatory protein RpfC n=1 Tax=Hydrogenophaga aromaticivorans TaxID=2610898 RepID=A0A7Y8GS57_9BURK|nr:hybrid sensor histidine kinase/response regulator [Hydrogenophaga aromaticivorans]NWF43865.1 response regulator [Hydrogenophaga aromaticivorans]
MPTTPQRLAHDFQRALQDLQKERERTRQLMAELDRQNHELDRLRSSVHRESNSRLLAEEALDETSDRLQLAVEAAGLALWDWQLPSQQVFLTARWGEMLGDIAVDGYWDTSALMDRVHPDDRARAQATAGELLQGRQQRTVVQYRVRTADGWLWIESHGMVAEHDAKGRPLRLMGSHADISERKRVEAEGAQARAQAEQASQAKSEFLANISHEVRTPLNALMGLTRLLMDSPLNTEQKSWLDLMDSSAHALLDLLNDVLDLSRIEAGKLSMENVQFPLRETLAEVSALYAEQARAKPLSWELQLSARLPDHMQGDPGRLRQVLNNLLSNALKFTPRGGRIRLTADLLTGSAGGAHQLRLQVQDSGVGIAKKHQSTIFDAFTQADASTARKFGGSGLGLAICSRLVQLMGGRIDLVSELGQGSTFTVTLPLGETAVADTGPLSAPMELNEVAQAGQRFAGLCVLVAEDHPVNELLMKQLLQRLGCSVRLARDGEQAVAQWELGGVDLVLMDVQMPGSNGLEATRRIREREIQLGRPHTPIVAVTANAMNGDREACLLAGMDGYSSKPVSPQTLIRAMDEALMRSARRVVPRAATPEPPPAHQPAVAGPLDIDKLRRRLDGDETTLRQLAQAMRTDLRQRLLALQQALLAQDIDMAVAHAHGLKGSLGSMTAERGARLAKGLELAARSRDWPLFGRALPLMQAEAKQIDGALAALLSAPPVA